jgi:hypothetical protein
MAKPPSSPPSSDIKGADRDPVSPRKSDADAAEGEDHARKESKARPKNTRR